VSTPAAIVRRLLRAGLFCGLATLALVIAATLPPRAVRVETRGWVATLPGTVVSGAYHVHTNRSDGTGSLDQVAQAAARAGLDFVIVSDHGDASQAPIPPSYRSGVLCLDASEISTAGGHYVAIGLPRAPYRLGGDAREVVEDVARLGGIGIAAHPDSAKKSLRWSDWSLPIDGFEWLSADSEWRDESRSALARTALHYAWRAPQAIVSLFDRPETTLARWDEAAGRGRRLVALAALDAHARLGPRGFGEDPDARVGEWGEGLALPVPSYDVVFKSLTTRVEIDQPLARDASEAATQLVSGLRRGRVFTVIDALAGPGAFEFSAARADGPVVRMGDIVAPGSGPLRFTVRVAAPASSRVVLLRNGTIVAENTGTELLVVEAPDDARGHAAYRAEVYVPDAPGHPPVPWILGNPIYVGVDTVGARPVEAPKESRAARWLYADEEEHSWRLEHDRDSVAAVSTVPAVAGRMLVFRFGLASGKPDFWAALVRNLAPPVGDATRLRFKARANRPVRLSVQLRASSAGGAAGLRWRRSVYLDETERDLSVALEDMSPVGRGTPAAVPPSADAILFVVDGVHASAGATGIIWLDAIRLER